MPTIIDEKKKIIIIAPPKCGCSTVRYCFGKTIGIEDLSEVNRTCQALLKKYKDESMDEFKIYFIYRDVEERFVSFVKNVLEHRILCPQRSCCLNEKWSNYLKICEEHEKLNMNTSINTVLKIQENIMTRIGTMPIDAHGFPQTFFLNEFLNTFKQIKKSRVQYISVANLSSFLSEYYDVETKNKTNYKTEYEPSSEKLTIKKTFNKKQLTSHHKEILRSIYKDDYDFINNIN